MNIEEACRKWVDGFNAIPMSAVEKLYEASNYDDFNEITPPTVGDRIYVHSGRFAYKYGEIVKTKDKEGLYVVRLDGYERNYSISPDDFQVEYESTFPMWGWMWSFGDNIDEEWANGEYLGPHLQEMSDCGFRIYESEDFGVVFGIDGCGYDFYESHWIPLYKVRGLQWHEVAA